MSDIHKTYVWVYRCVSSVNHKDQIDPAFKLVQNFAAQFAGEDIVKSSRMDMLSELLDRKIEEFVSVAEVAELELI